MNPRILKYVIFFILDVGFAYGQTEGVTLPCIIIDGDTLPHVSLPEFLVFQPKSKTEKEIREWNRLVYNVRKVYPYAKIAGEKMAYFNEILEQTKTEKERGKVMKQAEKEIKAEFEKDLRNLTFSQGKVLLKLLHRETGESSYALLRDFRGDFSVFFYQGFARVFGYNLKVTYDKYGDDRSIEAIVWMIECGRIEPIPIPPKESKGRSAGKKRRR